MLKNNLLVSLRKLKRNPYFNFFGLAMLSLGYICLLHVFADFLIYGNMNMVLTIAALAFFCSGALAQLNISQKSKKEFSIRTLLGASSKNLYGLILVESTLRSFLALILSLIILESKLLQIALDIQPFSQSLPIVSILFFLLTVIIISMITASWAAFNIPNNNLPRSLGT